MNRNYLNNKDVLHSNISVKKLNHWITSLWSASMSSIFNLLCKIWTRGCSVKICVTLTASLCRGGLSLLNMSILSSNIQRIKMDFQFIPPNERYLFFPVCHPSSVRRHWLSSLPKTPQLLLLLVFVSVHTTSEFHPTSVQQALFLSLQPI